jgi:hypothetical protein
MNRSKNRRRKKNPLATYVEPQRGYSHVVNALRSGRTVKVHAGGGTYTAMPLGGDRYGLLHTRGSLHSWIIKSGSAGQVATALIRDVGPERAMAMASENPLPFGLTWEHFWMGTTALAAGVAYWNYLHAQRATANAQIAQAQLLQQQLMLTQPGGATLVNTQTITPAQAGQTITCNQGDNLVLALPNAGNVDPSQTNLWTITPSVAGAITAAGTPTTLNGTASYPMQASQAGTVTLTVTPLNATLGTAFTVTVQINGTTASTAGSSGVTGQTGATS